MFRLRLSY